MKKSFLIFLSVTLLLSVGNQKYGFGQTYHLLSGGSLTQDWTNIGLITANDDWTGLSSIRGYRGDNGTATTGVDPQTVLADLSGVLNVTANQTTPGTLTSGGLAEFEISNPVVAFQGSGTADAPNLVLFVNTTGCTNVKIKYDLRDVDDSSDDAVQPVALQYRIGASGDYINIPSGFVADASSGPSMATLITHVEILLPSACFNQAQVQLRIITTNAVGSDEWIGIDNIAVEVDATAPVPAFYPANGAVDIAVNVNPTITFDEPVRKTDGTPIVNADLTSIVAFSKTDAFGQEVIFSGTIDASKKVITIIPNATLLSSQVYFLSIGPVEDVSGNESFTKSVTFTTTTAVTPTITLIYPNGSEKLYSGDLATITWSTTNFDPGENIKIEAYVLDEQLAWKWITLIPSTPNDGSETVTVGPAPYGTQYLIRVSGVTNGSYDQSNLPFTIISTATTLEILRLNQIGAIVKYKGVATVTYARSSNNQKYIQDATAAILIHDPSGYVSGTYTVGSGITNVEGKITLYNGLLELVPQAATGENATGGTVTVETVNITNLTYNDQSKLVKLAKMKFASPSGNFAAATNYAFDGISTNYVLRTAFSEADYITAPTPVPTGYFDVVVLVGQYLTAIQVTPIKYADFTLLSSSKSITSFKFEALDPDVTGTIDETGKTVTLSVPGGTNVTALVPTIAVSAKATVSPLSGVAANFTSPIVYTVTAEDGTTQAYTVTVSTQTGIEKISEMDIKIYPVPATSELKVNNFRNLQTIEVLDVTGRVIQSININNDQEIRIPLGNLRKGMYLLRFNTTNGKVIKRFIKS